MKRLPVLFLAAMAASIAPSIGWSQVLEEVVVTAQKGLTHVRLQL